MDSTGGIGIPLGLVIWLVGATWTIAGAIAATAIALVKILWNHGERITKLEVGQKGLYHAQFEARRSPNYPSRS